MKNVFERHVDVSSLKGKPLADYKPDELVAFLLHAYPGDPLGALKCMRENLEVGFVLGETAKILLEGLSNVKRD